MTAPRKTQIKSSNESQNEWNYCVRLCKFALIFYELFVRRKWDTKILSIQDCTISLSTLKSARNQTRKKQICELLMSSESRKNKNRHFRKSVLGFFSVFKFWIDLLSNISRNWKWPGFFYQKFHTKSIKLCCLRLFVIHFWVYIVVWIPVIVFPRIFEKEIWQRVRITHSYWLVHLFDSEFRSAIYSILTKTDPLTSFMTHILVYAPKYCTNYIQNSMRTNAHVCVCVCMRLTAEIHSSSTAVIAPHALIFCILCFHCLPTIYTDLHAHRTFTEHSARCMKLHPSFEVFCIK